MLMQRRERDAPSQNAPRAGEGEAAPWPKKTRSRGLEKEGVCKKGNALAKRNESVTGAFTTEHGKANRCRVGFGANYYEMGGGKSETITRKMRRREERGAK